MATPNQSTAKQRWKTVRHNQYNREIRLFCWKKDRNNCLRRRLKDSRLDMALTVSPSRNQGHPRLAETKPWLWRALYCQVQASTAQTDAQTGQGTARVSAQQLLHMKDKARNRRGNKLNRQIRKPHQRQITDINKDWNSCKTLIIGPWKEHEGNLEGVQPETL